jgi:peptidoglycan/xylan/chitin deacetylase (PgdA/CDA1 family)
MDVISLCYHAVSPTWPAELAVTASRFERQIGYLARRGYRGVTFSEAVAGQVTGKVVAITFDDGYVSTARLARPILDRFGMPATVFLPTDFIGGGPMSWPGIDGWIGTEHERELVPMSWDDAREMVAAGWEIGSHSKSHPRLTQVTDDRLEEELTESRLECERNLGLPCRSLAYPYGDFDERVIIAADKAGYASAATFPSRTPLARPLAWPRIGIFHQDGPAVFRLKVSSVGRRLRESRAWTPLVRPIRKLTGRPRI